MPNLLLILFVLASAVRAAPAKLTPTELAKEIEARRLRVPEFAEIAKMAKKRGLRVYLFGGTAAGLAHYIKWDTLREQGDTRYQAERFDYDYLSIYRSNQDIDLVVTRADGTAESPAEIGDFQDEIARRFPYLQGGKSKWEVRGLKTPRGGKEALLDDPDFARQHTDSQSTGLIDLTTGAVSDLRAPARFLGDVAAGTVRYYFSKEHDRTARAKRGDNPPIISAIRCLTKAFQYDLEIDPKSLKQLRWIIDEYDPKAKPTPYVRGWIERNGKKLLQNAASIERAWNTLEELGLRKKLIRFSGSPERTDSLAWWLSKEPLRREASAAGHVYENGLWADARKKGRTARQLGIDVVAHSSLDYEAYESILRSPSGIPNALISRDGHAGERAVYGDGFYTQVGEQGAWNGGFHVRFKVDPNAREGVDFVVIEGNGPRWVLWKNSKKLTAIPESMALSVPEILSFLLMDDDTRRDAPLHHKLIRKLQLHNPRWPADEMEDAIRSMYIDYLPKIFLPNPDVPDARKLVQIFSDVGGSAFDLLAVREILPKKEWANHENGEYWLLRAIKHGNREYDFEDIENLLHAKMWKDNPRFADYTLRLLIARSLYKKMNWMAGWEGKRKWPKELESLFDEPLSPENNVAILATYLKKVDDDWLLRDLVREPEWKKRFEDPALSAKLIELAGNGAKRKLKKWGLLVEAPCVAELGQL